MRILHVNKFLYRRGGAESYMLDLAELQRARGDEVAFFGMQHSENIDGLALSDTFPGHVELEPPPRGIAGVAAGARMVWSLSSSHGMAQALRRFQPDVVHCHNIYHQLSPSILAPVRRAGVRCVMTLHDYKLACPSYQLLDGGELCDACVGHSRLNAVRRRCKSDSLGASALLALESSLHHTLGAYRPVDVFICPSRFLASVMARAGIEPQRLEVVNHFLEMNDPKMEISASHSLESNVDSDVHRRTPDRRPVDRAGFVFAGRLSAEKGVDILVRAAGLMRSGAPVHIAGDGPARPELERLATELSAGRVTFHGRLRKDELAALVGSCVASVVPSRWHENQPMTILESYAAQVPAVVTNLGGMPELVRDGEDGLIVPHDDPGALAAALDTLDANRDLALRMGRLGRERLAGDFEPERHLQRLERIYRGEPAVVADTSIASAEMRG